MVSSLGGGTAQLIGVRIVVWRKYFSPSTSKNKLDRRETAVNASANVILKPVTNVRSLELRLSSRSEQTEYQMSGAIKSVLHLLKWRSHSLPLFKPYYGSTAWPCLKLCSIHKLVHKVDT